MKAFTLTALFSLLALPAITFAQQPGIQEYIPAILEFLSNTVIVFLIGVAFLIFVINIVRYFIIDGANEQTRGEARMYAIYSFFAFVIFIVFWGLVTMIATSLGLSGCSAVNPDYLGGEPGGTDCYVAPVSAPAHTNPNTNPLGTGGSNPPPTGGSGGTGTPHSGPNPATGGGGTNPAP